MKLTATPMTQRASQYDLHSVVFAYYESGHIVKTCISTNVPCRSLEHAMQVAKAFNDYNVFVPEDPHGGRFPPLTQSGK